MKEIIKEAGVLRCRLLNGSINIHELDRFLERVEHYAPPSTGPKPKVKSGFVHQLENLELGRARKPKF